jgi:hypothetical protein
MPCHSMPSPPSFAERVQERVRLLQFPDPKFKLVTGT